MNTHCQYCGGRLEHDRCPACGAGTMYRFVQREIVALTVLCAVTVLVFAGTRALALAYGDLRERDAAEWYSIGQARLEGGRPDAAADAFRHASAMNREHAGYRLALATALGAAKRDDAARQVLLGMRALVPESPEVNVRLARLEARRADRDAAVRYYQNALYGLWPPDQVEERRRLRVEFIHYLLAENQQSRALAEVLALEGNMLEEPAAHLEAARLFREAGDSHRALAHYERTLRLDPKNADAFAGAGEAAFQLGDYSRAQRHLRNAPADAPGVPELRTITSLVLTRDPLLPRLAYAERRRRLLANLADSIEHLADCPADPDASPALRVLQEEAREVEASLRRETRAQPLERIETGVDLVHRIQREVERCGASSPSHYALLIIGQKYQVEAP